MEYDEKSIRKLSFVYVNIPPDNTGTTILKNHSINVVKNDINF